MAVLGLLFALVPKSMQQIAILSLICLTANGVHGIQNVGNNIGSQIGSELTPRSDYYTVEYEPTTTTTTTNHLPPTELIGFTLADATVNRPPTSYHTNGGLTSTSSTSLSASASTSAATYGQRYQAAATLVPPQLQTTPVLSYRDPYTDEHHYYTPSQQQRYEHLHHHGHHQHQHQQQQLITVDTHAQPQEYTVQSSLLVDAASANQDFDPHKRRITGGGGGPAGYGQQRPGLVFAEPLGVSSSSVAALYAPNYAATRPLGPYTRPTRPPPPPRPPAPPAAALNGAQQRPYLSYDSHDYPPPSYYQQQPQQQQQQLYAQSPQRQDTTAPNYANNFGNYLPSAQHQQQQLQQDTYYRPLPAPPSAASRPPAARPPPAYDNYYNYQLGELPPQATRPNYRPPPPQPPPPTSPAQTPFGGLANLATLITSGTQQYAPQFTNLLLGTLGVGGGGGSGLTSSIASNLVGGGNRPLNMQLIKALENIARNDELQCVPKVLCQMIARQTERGQLPSVVTSPAITNFLAGFPAASPALIYGRAALLGISGGETSCTRNYAKCPKNEYEILYYLNNHRGGFFKFFSEPEEKETQQTYQQQQQQQQNDDGGGSILSFISALTGGGIPGAIPTSTPRPRPTTEAPSAFDNISSGIGSFFTQVLSDYLGGGVEYQRRRRRRDLTGTQNEQLLEDGKEEEEEDAPLKSPGGSITSLPEDFHDPEDNEDTQTNESKESLKDADSGADGANGGSVGSETFQFAHIESRILHKDDVRAVLEHPKFFPDDEEQQERLLRSIITQFNASKASRRLKFPTAAGKTTDEDQQQLKASKELPTDSGRVHFEDVESTSSSVPLPHRKYRRRGKKLIFKEAGDTKTAASQHPTSLQPHQVLTPQGGRVIFPDGTRSGRILNRPNEESATSANDEADKFVISSAHRPEASAGGGGSIYYSQSHNSDSHYSSSITNRYSSTYSTHGGGSGGGANKAFKMYDSLGSAPSAQNSAGYGNMRYSSRYQTSTTRRPTPTPHEDNKNIYVTNGHGVTEYFITPEGRKVYL